MQNPTVIVAPDPIHLAQKGAEVFFHAACKSVSVRGCFMVAVSGGSTPRPMHRLLAQDPYRSEMPWDKVHIFWADERNVASDHPDSNYGAAKMDFIEKVPLPEDHIHVMPVWLGPQAGIRSYQERLASIFDTEEGNPPIFDLIFLGVGTDGHTASLFPGQKAPVHPGIWVVSVRGGRPNVRRFTMTYSILNAARHIVFMVSGKQKARILKRVLRGRSAGLPAERIQPANGELTWLIDREAAAGLPRGVAKFQGR